MSSTQQLLLGEGAGGAILNFIEEVFSTQVYTGAGTSKIITNNIDLSTKGGLVWTKMRASPASNAHNHRLSDSAIGVNKVLSSNNSDPQTSSSSFGISSFNVDGYTITNPGADGGWNYTNDTFVSWTFRKQPKFFDVVTYTGNGSSPRNIAHNLGSTPGCMIVKSTSTSDAWYVWHTSLGASYFLTLADTTAAQPYGSFTWGGSNPTSTQFTTGVSLNNNGTTYVAYLFAHNAGGFGLTGADNVITCGSSSTNSSGNDIVDLGFEPQWVMIKPSGGAGGDWEIRDIMRGFSYTNPGASLFPNLADAEVSSNGFLLENSSGGSNGFRLVSKFTSRAYIYVAIRRGPMKVPTVGTSVFAPTTYTGNGTTNTVTTGFVTDLVLGGRRNQFDEGTFDRLRGNGNCLVTSSTGAESGVTIYDVSNFAVQNGFGLFQNSNASLNTNGQAEIAWSFRRAPSFFDEVCYTVSGYAANNVAHNLTVTPEIFITKPRTLTGSWTVYGSIVGSTNNYMTLNVDYALQTSGGTVWGATSSTFSEPSTVQNGTYVCYLFATCAGVSKVFSYTGNGSSQTINCGFTAGSRFVLIKRTDSTGDWYVWDSARGIVAGNDPHLSLNSIAAEVTTDDSVDTDNTGFIVNQLSATNVNVTSATYIGIAIA